MNTAISKLKNNKAPGTDGVRVETFKMACAINKKAIKRMFGKIAKTDSLSLGKNPKWY